MSKDAILQKTYNVLIPICLGNKFFSKDGVISDSVRQYIDWALVHTQEKVLIIVVDKIQDTNYFVRNKKRTEAASLRRVLKEGEMLRREIQHIVDTYNNPHISVIVWQDYENTDPYWRQTTDVVYRAFAEDVAFQTAVIDAVKSSLTDRVFSEDEYKKLAEYVLDEFCIVYNGATYNNEWYGVYVYPETDAVVHLIEAIKSGNVFPHLHEMLPKQYIGLGILNTGK